MPPITIGTSLIRLAHALRIDDHAAVRTLPAVALRRVGVIAAHAPVRGVAVHHRIHVAGGDAEEQIGLAQRLERCGAVPVRLRDDADAKPCASSSRPMIAMPKLGWST